MVDIEHRALRALEHHRLARGKRLVQEGRCVSDEGLNLFGGANVLAIDLGGVERFGVEQGMHDGVLLAAGILDVRLHQRKVEHVRDAQSAASHFVFVGWADTAGGGADLHAPGSIFRGELNHAVIGKDHLGTIADKQIAINLYTCIAQRLHFLEQREGIENDAIADHGTAARAKNATGHKLQNELAAGNGDRMPGVVSARISCNDSKVFGKIIDDLSFSLVAPLGADNDGSFAPVQERLLDMVRNDSQPVQNKVPAERDGQHTLLARLSFSAPFSGKWRTRGVTTNFTLRACVEQSKV